MVTQKSRTFPPSCTDTQPGTANTHSSSSRPEPGCTFAQDTKCTLQEDNTHPRDSSQALDHRRYTTTRVCNQHSQIPALHPLWLGTCRWSTPLAAPLPPHSIHQPDKAPPSATQLHRNKSSRQYSSLQWLQPDSTLRPGTLSTESRHPDPPYRCTFRWDTRSGIQPQPGSSTLQDKSSASSHCSGSSSQEDNSGSLTSAQSPGTCHLSKQAGHWIRPGSRSQQGTLRSQDWPSFPHLHSRSRQCTRRWGQSGPIPSNNCRQYRLDSQTPHQLPTIQKTFPDRRQSVQLCRSGSSGPEDRLRWWGCSRCQTVSAYQTSFQSTATQGRRTDKNPAGPMHACTVRMHWIKRPEPTVESFTSPKGHCQKVTVAAATMVSRSRLCRRTSGAARPVDVQAMPAEHSSQAVSFEAPVPPLNVPAGHSWCVVVPSGQ